MRGALCWICPQHARRCRERDRERLFEVFAQGVFGLFKVCQTACVFVSIGGAQQDAQGALEEKNALRLLIVE